MRFFDSTMLILGTQGLALLAVFAINVLISRAFGEAGKGAVALLINSAEVMVIFAHLALGTSSQYFVGKQLASPRQLSGNFLFFPIMLLLALLSLAGLTWPLWSAQVPASAWVVIGPAIPLALLMLVYEPSCQLLIAIGRVGLRSVLVLVQNGLVLLAVLLAVLALPFGVQSVIWGYVVAFALTVALVLRQMGAVCGAPAAPSWRLLKATMGYGGWIYAANLIGHFAARIDFFIVTALAGIQAGGVYSVAMGLTSPITIIVSSVNSIFYPRTTGETDDETRRTTPFFYRQMLLLLLVTAAGVALLARPVLGIFGPGFLAGHAALLYLLTAAVFRGVNGILTSHLLGRGYPHVKTILTSVMLALMALGCWLLIPALGMKGAAISAAASGAVENTVLLVLYARVGGGEVRELYNFRRGDFVAIIVEGRSFLKRLGDGWGKRGA